MNNEKPWWRRSRWRYVTRIDRAKCYEALTFTLTISTAEHIRMASGRRRTLIGDNVGTIAEVHGANTVQSRLAWRIIRRIEREGVGVLASMDLGGCKVTVTSLATAGPPFATGNGSA